MVTHVKSLTYEPKIPRVLSGEIRQTIRIFNPNRPVKIGDTILFHGWKGKPTFSKWSWRMWVEVEVIHIIWCFREGYAYSYPHGPRVRWSEDEADQLALEDGVSSGVELAKILEKMNATKMKELYGVRRFPSWEDDDNEGIPFQVIRWRWPPLKFMERSVEEWEKRMHERIVDISKEIPDGSMVVVFVPPLEEGGGGVLFTEEKGAVDIPNVLAGCAEISGRMLYLDSGGDMHNVVGLLLLHTRDIWSAICDLKEKNEKSR